MLFLVRELQAARRVEAHPVAADDSEEPLIRYAAALCHANVALGAALVENMTFAWSWRDAFKPALVCQARGCAFERVAVLWNLAAHFSQRAALRPRPDLEATRAAKGDFERSAGCFEHLGNLLGEGGLQALNLQTRVGEAVQAAAPWDLSPAGLRMARGLMLAQAQACCYEECLKGGCSQPGATSPLGSAVTSAPGSVPGSAPGDVARVAAGAAAMFQEAAAEQRSSRQLMELDPSWARHMHFQAAVFEVTSFRSCLLLN